MATTSVTISTSQSNHHAQHMANGKCQCGCAPCQQTCCQLDCIVQPRFFSGQLLTDQDLNVLLSWAQDKLRLSRYRHGWGVVCGLEVHCDPKYPDKVIVGPGYAIDCCGDDIVVCHDASVDLSAVCRDEQGPCAEWKQPSDGATAIQKTQIGDQEILADRVRVIDLYIRYQTEDSDPQLVMSPSACRNSSRCEPTRTRESSVVTWRKAAVTDPMTEAADRWVDAYDETLEVIRRFRQMFPRLAGSVGEEVRSWFLCWIEKHPLHQFCFLRSQIVETKNPDDFENEAKIAWLLFWMVQDYRNAFLRCECFGCEENIGVPLARIWIQVRDNSNKPICRVLAIDPYPPYRRPLSRECWPAPLGKLNLAQFIGRRWQEVCRELDDLGVVVSGVMDFVVPNTLAELERALVCDPFVGCVEEWSRDAPTRESRVVELYDFKGFGRRVVGICGPERLPVEQPGVSVTKTSIEKSARPGQKVNYVITVKNTGKTRLTLKVEEQSLTGDVVLAEALTLEPEATRDFKYVVTLPGEITTRVIKNSVRVTGKDPDGRTVSAQTSHSLPVSTREAVLTDITGLTTANADRLKTAGIGTVESLAETPIEKLQEIIPRIGVEKLREWINEAKKLVG